MRCGSPRRAERFSIAAGLGKGSVALRVSDTGCGVGDAHVAHLFESFYRVPGQGSDTGTGLAWRW